MFKGVRMKKLMVAMLFVFSGASLSSQVRAGLDEIASGAREVVRGAADAAAAPFDGDWRYEKEEDKEYKEDVRKAKEKRDDARQDIKENGDRGWFGKKADPNIAYDKAIARAKEKRDQRREQRRKKEDKEMRNEREVRATR
jgi:hypothetical protein